MNTYTPHGALRDLFRARDTEILIEGPAGTGKSRAVLEYALAVALKYPGCRVLLCRKTRAAMSQSVLVDFEAHVLPESAIDNPRANRVSRSHYTLRNGSEIAIGGLDNVDRIMSAQYDLICLFEATEATEDDWEKLCTRLRNNVAPVQRAIADCNPAGPGHWLNQRANDARLARIRSRHADNPTVTAAYLAKLEKLTGVRRARLYEGRWAIAEGAVWPEYDAAVHIVNPLDREKTSDWRRFVVVDFGYVNPAVAQFWAVSPDGVMYREREHYHTGWITHKDLAPRIAAEMHKRLTWEAVVCDHDAEERATLESAGIKTIAADKAVETGIQAVAQRLKDRRLLLCRDALIERDTSLSDAGKPTCTEEEIENYRWSVVSAGKPVKESPIKVDDHGCDALRYAVQYVDRPRAEWLRLNPQAPRRKAGVF